MDEVNFLNIREAVMMGRTYLNIGNELFERTQKRGRDHRPQTERDVAASVTILALACEIEMKCLCWYNFVEWNNIKRKHSLRELYDLMNEETKKSLKIVACCSFSSFAHDLSDVQFDEYLNKISNHFTKVRYWYEFPVQGKNTNKPVEPKQMQPLFMYCFANAVDLILKGNRMINRKNMEAETRYAYENENGDLVWIIDDADDLE